MASSVIFIGSPEKSPRNWAQTVRKLFTVPPRDLSFRIFASFVPPLTKTYQKVYVDFLGPVLGLLFLAAFVNYGSGFKAGPLPQPPTETILLFAVFMPVLCLILCKLGRSSITLSETVSLIGYSFYGHIATLLVSFLCFEERSNFFFFVCLIIFGGLSTLRVALVFLGTIPVPAARLLICSLVSIVNILFLIFLHFAFMHSTYTYRDKNVIN